MNLPVFLRPEAQDDVVAARDWYGERREGLGQDFLTAMEDFIAHIGMNPQIHAPVIRDVLRGLIRRSPYVVYYRPLADRIEIVAVLHGRRMPSEWEQRLS